MSGHHVGRLQRSSSARNEDHFSAPARQYSGSHWGGDHVRFLLEPGILLSIECWHNKFISLGATARKFNIIIVLLPLLLLHNIKIYSQCADEIVLTTANAPSGFELARGLSLLLLWCGPSREVSPTGKLWPLLRWYSPRRRFNEVQPSASLRDVLNYIIQREDLPKRRRWATPPGEEMSCWWMGVINGVLGW